MERYNIEEGALADFFRDGQRDARLFEIKEGSIPRFIQARAQATARRVMVNGVITPKQPGEAYEVGIYHHLDAQYRR